MVDKKSVSTRKEKGERGVHERKRVHARFVGRRRAVGGEGGSLKIRSDPRVTRRKPGRRLKKEKRNPKAGRPLSKKKRIRRKKRQEEGKTTSLSTRNYTLVGGHGKKRDGGRRPRAGEPRKGDTEPVKGR